ncbi:hypothetical protein IQ247_20970 [Plectonema cf. radiosum LEGE 06105]|uniref:Uncharacterized protein n=1 Tax=Plectonema cf. radiosum LEGE 06105 TaxID=945769 RepID=A0A8J7F6U3_9CYAN|nr:hypothetical protein [Plectonema radiosum]MBE9215105.1 hypothetical protein [Plectonema cf. radiosum LEGE 06105]
MSRYNLPKNSVASIIIATLCFSCNSRVNTEKQQSQANAQQNPQPNIVYGDLIIKEESDYLMIPVSIFPDANQGEKSWIEKSSRSYEDRQDIYNIIFYSKKDASTNALLDKKAIIKSFDLIERKATAEPIQRFWLYRIIQKDTNEDKKLDYQDATIGYLSDLSGRNLQQITPDNTQLNSWIVVQSTGAIFLEITKDTNKDQKFDTKKYIRVNLDNPSIGKEIITNQLEDQIKSYILKIKSGNGE